MIKLNNTDKSPIYEQIRNQLRLEIIEGHLMAGDPLPSIRSLAKDLQISVITTKRAYEELEREGLIYSIPQKGFFVSDTNKDYLKEKRLRIIDEKIEELVEECKIAGLSGDEVCEMIKVFFNM